MEFARAAKHAALHAPLVRKALLALWAATARRTAARSIEDRPDTEDLRGVVGRLGRRPSDPAAQEWFPRLEARRATLSKSEQQVRVTNTAWGGTREGDVTTVGELCVSASKNAPSCALLFDLVRTMRPLTCIEMGTSVGVSGSYLGAALKANGAGRLFTMEGQPDIAESARDTFRALGLDAVEVTVGAFDDILPDLAARVSPVDFAFVDGHHQEDPTFRYFEILLPFMSPGAIMVFDDIAWNEGMRRVWAKIRSDPRAAVAVDLKTFGLIRVAGS